MKFAAVLVAATVLCGSLVARAGRARARSEIAVGRAGRKPGGPEAERLADRIRAYFGGRDVLMRGAPARVDELTVAFALEAPNLPATGPAPRAVADHGMFNLPLTKVGTGGLYAGVAHLTHGAAFTWHYEAGGARFGGGQLEVYETHPDARERAGVPKGTLKQMPSWQQQDFPGHHARLVGLRAGSVQRGEPGGGYGVSGWRRRTAIRRRRCSTT